MVTSLSIADILIHHFFFGMFNNAWTWNRPQRIFNDNFFFPLLPSLNECLIIPTNRWIHCNVYKCKRRRRSWIYFISAHAITSGISISAEFQNLNFFIDVSSSSDCLRKKKKKRCSLVQFGHCFTFRASPGAWCLYDRSAIANRLSSQLFFVNRLADYVSHSKTA